MDADRGLTGIGGEEGMGRLILQRRLRRGRLADTFGLALLFALLLVLLVSVIHGMRDLPLS